MRILASIFFVGTIFTTIGYILLNFRYGKKHMKIVDKYYDGFYAGVTAKIVRIVITILWLMILLSFIGVFVYSLFKF